MSDDKSKMKVICKKKTKAESESRREKGVEYEPVTVTEFESEIESLRLI